jgi:hypothetical protein
MATINDINIPRGPLVEQYTQRPTREWLMYFLGLGRTFAYGSFQNTADQTFATANTPELIVFNLTDYANNMYLQSGDGIHVQQTGVYNIQFSFQLANTSSSIHEFYIWLRKNGVDVDGTASKVSVIARHGSTDGYVIMAANFYLQLNLGEYVELWGAVSNTAVYIEAYPAQTSPFVHPAIPSSVVTINQVNL